MKADNKDFNEHVIFRSSVVYIVYIRCLELDRWAITEETSW